MQRRTESVAHEIEERLPPVLSNRPFFLLWLAQIISQTAQNAILFALIVIVVDKTESTTSTSGVVLAFAVPTAAFGIFAGIIVDHSSKRRLLILTNAGRAVTAVAFAIARDHVWALYTVTIAFSTLSQLFTTTNAVSIPSMVPRAQLISANSLFSGGFTIAQIAGMIVLSPVLLKTGGAGVLFACAAAAFVVASLLTQFLPPIGEDGAVTEGFPTRAELRGAVAQFGRSLSVLRADSQSTLAMIHITMSSTLILLFAIMVPRYMQAILDVHADNTYAVFAPVAVGALVGLRAVPLVVARLGKTRTVALGLFGLAFCLACFGLVETIADGLRHTDRLNPFGTDRVFGLSILVALTMLFAGPMGIAYAMLNTPAQTTLHERTPVEMRGRIIASQMVLANGVALVPLVVVGGIADLYGVSSVVLAIAALVALGGALTLYLEQRWLRDEGSGPPPSGEQQPEWGSPQAVTRSIDTA